MSDPARLYLCSPSCDTPSALIAESYSDWDDLPGLWRVLLIGAARFDAPPAHEEGTAIASTAMAAIGNLDLFRRVVDSHPLLHRIAELPLFLTAIESYLREQIATFPKHQRNSLMLVAQHTADEQLPPSLCEELADLGPILNDIMVESRHWELDELLGFACGRMQFTQWRPWVERFGLDTLCHPYFSRLEISAYDESEPVPPAAVRFEDYGGKRTPALWTSLKNALGGMLRRPHHPDDEADDIEDSDDDDDDDDDDHDHDHNHDELSTDEGDPWLGSGFRPVTVAGKVGLRFVPQEAVFAHIGMTRDEYVDPAPDRLALAAEWSDTLAVSNTAAWVCRDGKWSPIALRRDCHRLTDVWVDAVVQEQDSWGVHVVKDGLRGLICMDTGCWLTEPAYDEMVWSDGEPGPVWRVRLGQRWGLLSTNGVLLHDCVFDSLPTYQSGIADYAARGLHVLRDGRAGWVSHQGVLEIACRWDEVKPCAATGLFAVRQDGLWGLVARGDRQWLPCMYLHVEPLALAAHLGVMDLHWSRIGEYWWPDETPVDELAAAGDPAQANLLIAVRTSDGMGVVDQANRSVVPIRYAAVTAADNGDFRDPRWLCLTARDGRAGLWSVAAAAEVFPCQYRCLDLFLAPRITRPLVGIPDGQHYRLWHVDGTPAFTERFLSISEDGWEHDGVVAEGVGTWDRAGITEAWLEGRPIRVRLADDQGTMMFLLPGQPLASLEQTLENQYRAGDDEAALTLAKDSLRSGNQAAARLWAARACGHEPRAIAVAGEEPGDDEYESRKERERFGKRARFFAGLLDEGIGGPRDAALALYWVRAAAEAQPFGPDPDILLLLGKLLLDPEAGPVDRQAAVDVLTRIHYPNLEEGMASLLLARCALEGAEPDLELARAWLVRADGAGAGAAAPELAALLDRMAALAARSKAPLLYQEAAYYRAKVAAR